MSRPFFSFKFAFFFSLSLAASYTVTSTPTFYSFRKIKLRASPSVPKASVADLLALLGPPQQALAVNSQEARQLRSCFKFLVPFSPTPNRRSLSDHRRSINQQNELIWWPPAPVMELARIAVDSGGDTASVQRTLDPTVIPVSFHIYLFQQYFLYELACYKHREEISFCLVIIYKSDKTFVHTYHCKSKANYFVIKISLRIIYYWHLI